MTSDLRVLISLHDVMPETLPHVERVLRRLEKTGIPPITLLVVPGCDWQPSQLEQLRNWSAAGHDLAAHGWRHRVDHISGIYHRLHSALISRNVAEHLALEKDEIGAFIIRSVNWFEERGFPRPDYYVPPAWALGDFSMHNLDDETRKSIPAHIETLSGILDTKTGRIAKLPLVGFEVDTALRAGFVRIWNQLAISRSLHRSLPLRISLHPYDFELRLAGQLEALICQPNLTPLPIAHWLSNP